MLRHILPLVSVLALAACGGNSEDSGYSVEPAAQAETPAPASPGSSTTGRADDQETVRTAAEQHEIDEVLSLAGADLSNGARQFRRCQSCHTLNEGGRHTIGPNLHGIAGNPAATRDGFAYSRQLSEAGLVWDLATLNQWIENPRDLVPGNRMSFVGLRNATDRRDVIAFILQETGGELETLEE